MEPHETVCRNCMPHVRENPWVLSDTNSKRSEPVSSRSCAPELKVFRSAIPETQRYPDVFDDRVNKVYAAMNLTFQPDFVILKRNMNRFRSHSEPSTTTASQQRRGSLTRQPAARSQLLRNNEVRQMNRRISVSSKMTGILEDGEKRISSDINQSKSSSSSSADTLDRSFVEKESQSQKTPTKDHDLQRPRYGLPHDVDRYNLSFRSLPRTSTSKIAVATMSRINEAQKRHYLRVQMLISFNKMLVQADSLLRASRLKKIC